MKNKFCFGKISLDNILGQLLSSLTLINRDCMADYFGINV